MKLNFKTSLIGLATICTLALPAFASDEYIGVVVNGKNLFLEQAPIMRDGRTLVPLRGIFEALGAKVKWDGSTHTVHSFTVDPENPTPDPYVENISIDLPLDSTTATVNGQPVTLDVPATLYNASTMVPLRFVSENMGAKVKWDGVNRLVRIAQPGFESTLEVPEEIQFSKSNWDIKEGLPRIQVGGQAGLLKILDPNKVDTSYLRTLDNYTSAQITDDQRSAVFQALGLSESELRDLTHKLITSYVQNRKNHLQVIALLGFICSEREAILDQATSERVQAFLVNKLFSGDPKLNENQNNVLKRQALVALALTKDISESTAEAVTKFYLNESNLYVLSPMPLFFKCHGQQIKQMPKYEDILNKVQNVETMYTVDIVDSLR